MIGSTYAGYIALGLAWLSYYTEMYQFALFLYLVAAFAFSHSIGVWLCQRLFKEKK